jgi:hypothetical protein
VAFVPESASGVLYAASTCGVSMAWTMCLPMLASMVHLCSLTSLIRCKSKGHYYLVYGHDQAMRTRGISLLEIST